MRKQWRQRLRELYPGRDTPVAPVSDPRHWRERAAAARAKVDHHGTSRSTRRLQLLADTYDRLAVRAEVGSRVIGQ